MKDNEGRMVEGEMKFWKYWQNTGESLAGKEMILKQRWEMWVGMSWLCVRSWEEVEVMKCLKRGKDAGPDGMNEMIMYRGGQLVELMLLMMNVVMKSECCPFDWKRSLLVPIHKNGDVEQVGNYRGIVLGCNVVEGVSKSIGEEVGKVC